jgi:hypothetical protein
MKFVLQGIVTEQSLWRWLNDEQEEPFDEPITEIMNAQKSPTDSQLLDNPFCQ